ELVRTFPNRTYMADYFYVNRIAMAGDHIPGAALSPLPLGEGRVRGVGWHNARLFGRNTRREWHLLNICSSATSII
ncbi:hypothetical protein, partial [Aeromonas caviae]